MEETKDAFNRLKCRLISAMAEYFNLPQQIGSKELLEKLKQIPASETDAVFIEWLTTEGFPSLEKIAASEALSEERLAAQLDYDAYIIAVEMRRRATLRHSIIDTIETLRFQLVE